MEFPNLGAHCNVSDCQMLDFLPLRCSGCHGIFCKNHFHYDCHNCPTPDIRDKQVPVCPLCGVPVPIRPGELPDLRVGNHIDTDCKSKPARELKGKLFTNACCMDRCKRKEIVPFICPTCHSNYCLMHRNELDHNCKKNQTTSRRISTTGAAAVFRAVFSGTSMQKVKKWTDSSLNHQSDFETARKLQEEEDRQLALALAASIKDNPDDPKLSKNSNTRSNESRCIIS